MPESSLSYSGPVATGGSGQGDRVLLVDDREDNLVALVAVLEPLGYGLLVARSGAEALRLVLDVEVSAIVLDVQMPDMDGFETAALLKSREATRSIPILFLTAVGLSVDHQLEGYEVGAFDYVCKPFEPRVLQAKVRAAVGFGSEMRALRRARGVYTEAAEALAAARVDVAGASGGVAAPPTTGVVAAPEPVVAVRVLDIELEASVKAPATARAALRKALAGQPEDWTDVIVLLVSELLANVVLHVHSSARLRLDVGPMGARVEVEDAGSDLPDVTSADRTDESGRGLHMVLQLADRCGWTGRPDGKSVWFELQRPDAASPG